MTAATAKPKKAAPPTVAATPPVIRDPRRDDVERRIDMAHAELTVGQELIATLEREHGDLESGPLNLAICEWDYFRRFLDAPNSHDVRRLLLQQRHTRLLREFAGDPQKLADAKAMLAAAIEVESTTRAAMPDLDGDDSSNIPELAKQIRRLQSKLDELTSKRRAAEDLVGQLEGARNQLRSLAPKWLRAQTERDVLAVSSNSEKYRRLCAVRSQIAYFKRVVAHWAWLYDTATKNAAEHHTWKDPLWWMSERKGDSQLVGFARGHAPEAFVEGPGRDLKRVAADDGGSATVELRKLHEVISRVVAVDLPSLQAEQEKLSAEWNSIVAQIEAPLTAWVETGNFQS